MIGLTAVLRFIAQNHKRIKYYFNKCENLLKYKTKYNLLAYEWHGGGMVYI